MVTHKTRPTHGGGYSVIHALIAVVLLGVGVTVAIPRGWAARVETLDGATVMELTRAVDMIEQYRRQHGTLPESASDAGFESADGIVLSIWKRQTIGGIESVHVHARHESSAHTFHAHYPLEPSITALEWEW